ncbi:MAG: hypothetical protein ABW088_00205 [Sedimenticola sp.]
MEIETILVGHTIVQRWKEGANRGISYLNEFGELITHQSEEWWKVFNVLKQPRVSIERTQLTQRFHGSKNSHKLIVLRAEGSGQMALFGPAWSDFYRAITTNPSLGIHSLRSAGLPVYPVPAVSECHRSSVKGEG